MIEHHPPLDLLFDYATGGQDFAISLAVAAHLEGCAECRSIVQQVEALGGVMLDELEPVDVSEGMLEAVMGRLDEAIVTPAAEYVGRMEHGDWSLPRALWPYIENGTEALRWQRLADLFEEAILPVPSNTHRVSLLRAQRGGFVPMHAHAGQEYLAVLHGGFRSNGHAYERGDFAYCDKSESHEPIVDTHDECVCLLVLDAPLNFKGDYKKTLDPIFRM